MGGLKFCKDCKWHVLSLMTSPHRDGSECVHPEFGSGNFDLVTGEPMRVWRFCRDVREDEALCGRDARWFEAK